MFCNHTEYQNVNSILTQLYSNPDPKQIVFVKDSQTEDPVSYIDLIEEATRVLQYMREHGVKAGNEVILQLEDNRKFLTGFVACVLGNIIAVPLTAGSQDEYKKKVRNVWLQMETPFLLGDNDTFKRLENFFIAESEEEGKWWQTIQSKLVTWPDVLPPADGDFVYDSSAMLDLVYIQFSSGSTGDPKGIRVSHTNILYNTDSILNSSASEPHETIVSWLPLSHDMGLVGCFLCGLLNNMQIINIPTSLFIRNPVIWLDKIQKHKGNISFSPNFGYKYLLQDWGNGKDSIQMDLSSLRIIYDGAEQISEEIIIDFQRTFKPHGLRDHCVFPCYGLAEATLAVTFHIPGTPIRSMVVDRLQLGIGNMIVKANEQLEQSMKLVSCGLAVYNMEVRICDEEHQPLEKGYVGLIEIKGPSITDGYYKQQKSPITADGWLITGDIGFFDGEELYVTGRHKEMIIVNGVNYYPYDIEKTLEMADAKIFALTKVVAAGVYFKEQDKEGLVVFVTSRQTGAGFLDVAELAKRTIMKHFGLVITDVVPVKRIPKTTSGKLQRSKLALEYIEDLQKQQPANTVNYVQEQSIIQVINNQILDLYGLNNIDIDKPLIDQGFDSLRTTELIARLNRALKTQLSPTVVFEYSTIILLARHIAQLKQVAPEVSPAQVTGQKSVQRFEPVAVIGMSCVFPGGANSPEQLWDVLINGVDTVTEVPLERWNAQDYYNATYQTAGTTNTIYASLIDNVQHFDAAFFGISPKEAESLDPQQRLLLDVSFQALQSARYSLQDISDSNTGVYIGFSHSDYTQAHIHSGQPDRIDSYSLTGTISSTAAGRLSYFYNLNGPAMILDTACSSSLVAVHNACRDLQYGDCSMAIAGGVNLILTPEPFVALTKMQALSPDGRCKTFDGSANGYGRGEGCGIVILKLLSKAIEDGDPIAGVIRSSVINHDGKSNGLTAPNGLAQQRLLQKSVEVSGLPAERISYLEAHGTGTPLGDPLEIQAANAAYHSNNRNSKLLIGSIKSNISHLESASGIAGVIKVLLAMRHHQLPANLHYTQPNPLIEWDKINIQVVDKNTPWRSTGMLAAGISSFGFSGTNANLIIEEVSATSAATIKDNSYVPCTLSAHNKAALKQMGANLLQYIQQNNDATLADICYHLNCTNNLLPYNWNATIKDKESLVCGLTDLQNSDDEIFVRDKNAYGAIAFQFTGQGSQYTGMGLELYNEFEVYRNTLNQCDELYRKYNNDISILSVIFDGVSVNSIDDTRFTQPAIFCTGYALAKLFESFGLKPDVLLGHSVGEIIAVCVAGMISLDDGIKLISQRANLMQTLPAGGGMLSIIAPLDQVVNAIAQLDIPVNIAGINSPTQTVVSGLLIHLQQIKNSLQAEGIICIPLTVSHAFHSELMQPIAQLFLDFVKTIQFKEPQIPVISNVTGQEFTKEQWEDAQYWVNHILQPVQYVRSMQKLQQLGCNYCIELGAQPVLTNLTKQIFPEFNGAMFVLRKGQHAVLQFLKTLSNLSQMGIKINWKQGYREFNYQNLQLPPYPFQRKKYWKELMIGKRLANNSTKDVVLPSAANRQILYSVDYKTIEKPSVSVKMLSQIILVYDEQLELSHTLRDEYINQGITAGACHINNLTSVDFTTGQSTVVYIANAAIQSVAAVNYRDAENAFELCKNLTLCRNIPAIVFISNNVFTAQGGTDVNINNSFLWGFATALKHEYPHIPLSVIDIAGPINIQYLLPVINNASILPLQLIVTDDTWMVPALKPIATNINRIEFKTDAAYIITGGLGNIGKNLINWMINKGARNFVITGRSQLTPQHIQQITNWQQQNCHVDYLKVDVSNMEQLGGAIKALTHLPPVKGIFHTAAILNDKLLQSHQADSFNEVFAAKVQGAFNLHVLSAQWQLDHFVMFSSTVALLGNTAQTNYAAANYFLNSLATLRLKQQLPAHSICWGPWQNSKMVEGLTQSFEDQGIELLTQQSGFNALQNALLQKNQTGVFAAIAVQPAAFMAKCPDWLSVLLPAEWQGIEKEASTVITGTLFHTEQEALAVLDKFSRSILQLDADDVLNTERPYFEIGFDSIMLSFLQARIKSYTGLHIAIPQFFQYPTLKDLAGYIVSLSVAQQATGITSVAPAYQQQLTDITTEEVSALSDNDIMKLLDQY